MKQIERKKFLLVLCKILQLFAKILTAKDKYSILNRDNLTEPIQMELSKKQKAVFQFLTAFLKSLSYFEYFKYNRHRLCICEIMYCERRG